MKEKGVKMSEIKTLFENQISELAMIELADKYPKEFEEIKNKLRNKFTIRISDFKAYLKELKENLKKLYGEKDSVKINIYFTNEIPEYIKIENLIYKIEFLKQK